LARGKGSNAPISADHHRGEQGRPVADERTKPFQSKTRLESIVSDKTPPNVEPTKSTEQPMKQPPAQPREIGGPKGPEPTRYNDWEKKGRCVDF